MIPIGDDYDDYDDYNDHDDHACDYVLLLCGCDEPEYEG